MSSRPWIAHYPEGVPADIEISETPVPAFLDGAVTAAPDRTALVFANARLSYRQLDEQVGRLATAFQRMGVGPGDRIAIHLPNIPQTVIAYFAALRAGGQVVMTNPMYTATELEHQWKDADCRVAVTTDYQFEGVIKDHRSSLPIRDYVIASIPEYLRFPLRLLAPLKLKRAEPPLWARVTAEDGVHPFRELIDRTPRKPTPTIGFDDVAVLQYTGGTTGVSKAAVLTHRNLSVNVQQIDRWFTAGGRGEAEVMLTCLPLFHVFGMTVAMNWAVARAMTMVLVPNPRDVDALLEAVVRHRVTIFPGVPAMYNALNSHPRIGRVDVSSVKACISGSAPIPVDVLERFESLTGATIVEGFGLSETSPVTHSNPLVGERRPGWIGLPLPNTDARIVDVDTGERELPPGEEGELVLRGPQVMREYWNQPEETAKALRDGWFFTGDLAVMSADGFFRIVGRKKDMINCSGFKVYPDEVDRVLASHEAILESATIGVPDPERGETVRSYVVLRPGARLTAEQIQEHCGTYLARYKVPREIEFIDELPKSSVLKVLRRELRERATRERA